LVATGSHDDILPLTSSALPFAWPVSSWAFPLASPATSAALPSALLVSMPATEAALSLISTGDWVSGVELGPRKTYTYLLCRCRQQQHQRQLGRPFSDLLWQHRPGFSAGRGWWRTGEVIVEEQRIGLRREEQVLLSRGKTFCLGFGWYFRMRDS